MSRTIKVSLITGITVLCLFMLFGCFFLMREGSKELGWYIQLNINNPTTAKAITVSEFEVTGLIVEVYDPNDVLLDTIEWVPQDGSTSSRIPVSEPGEYQILVKHSGEADGEVVTAEEHTTFYIKAMVITVIDVTPGSIGVITVDGGSQNGPSQEEYGALLLILSSGEMPTKTIAPPLDMNIAYYDVYGDGPDSATFSRLRIPGPTLMQSSLVAGEWTIIVDAFNVDDELIGDGSVVVTISAGQITQAEVSVVPLEGTGSLAIIISWPEGMVTSPIVTGTLTADGEAPENISFTLEENSASYTAVALDVGYYVLMVKLYDGENVIWGQLEAVRILKDQLSEAAYDINL